MASGTVISRGRGRGRGFGKGWVKDFKAAPCPVQPEEVGESLMFTREYHWLSCGVDFITTGQLHSTKPDLMSCANLAGGILEFFWWWESLAMDLSGNKA